MSAISPGYAEAEAKRVPISVVAATVAGNAMEFYDFLCYSFFAVYIAQAFFPTGSEYTSLLSTLAVFWVGFLFRPLGGLIIGAYADRAGRRAAMILTIGLVTIGTMGLALTPSFATIGIAAPIIVVTCRIIQGFALGGEIGPASAFLVESAPSRSRGLYMSWQLASQGIAVTVAGAVGVALTPLGQPTLAAWGWRVPFVICLAIVPLAFYLRRAMPETLEQGAPRAPSDSGLRNYWRIIVLGVLLILGGTVATYVGNYMTTFAIKTLNLPPNIALGATVVSGLSIIVFALLGGWCSDRFGRRATLFFPRVLLAIIIWPLFFWLSREPSATTLYIATAAVSGLTMMSSAAALVMVPELLPKRLRATGISIAYGLGVSIFGGSTQFVITWLIHTTGNPTSPAWYVIVTSLITIGAMLALPETQGAKLAE